MPKTPADPGNSTALLEGAYAIQTPQDSIEYYQDFAAKYDAEFIDSLGYIYPDLLAQIYHAQATADDLPVADIGCGTGVVAEKLGLPADRIDGFDISQDMLDQAQPKALYRALLQVDLTQPQSKPATPYGAIVSAGTFTHGHLGPAPLYNLLPLARPNALFCIGVNAQHFAAENFATTLDAMRKQGHITPYSVKTVALYEKTGHAHSNDKGQILIFRKSG